MNIHIRRRATEVRKEESGATVVIVALLMMVLPGMAAFALDFGWLYWNVIKVQHGADAAALSGVIYEPNDRAQAYVQVQTATENGYNPADAGTSVVPVDFIDDPAAVENSHQLRVTVTDAVPTFFMKAFGIDTVSITKHAVAEYILPLPIGSPEHTFGNDPATGYDPGFWGNIHGYYTDMKQGDRYSSQCSNGRNGSGCTPANDVRRETVYPNSQDATGGYLYGIEFDTDPSSVTVEIFDGPMTSGGGDHFLTGDQVPGYSDETTLPTTVFILYGPDPTPLNTSDNEVLCTVTYPPRPPYFDPTGDGKSDDADDLTGDGVLDWDDLDEPYVADGSGGLLGGVASLWDEMCPPGKHGQRCRRLSAPGVHGRRRQHGVEPLVVASERWSCDRQRVRTRRHGHLLQRGSQQGPHGVLPRRRHRPPRRQGSRHWLVGSG